MLFCYHSSSQLVYRRTWYTKDSSILSHLFPDRSGPAFLDYGSRSTAGTATCIEP